MNQPAISIENLCKAYRIGLEEQRHDTLVGSVLAAARYPLKNFHRLRRLNTFTHQEECEDIFWALRDVSFDVADGEVVGIIGRNGAGKSTLLKVLSRITEPTSGRAIIRGRVSSLLEVGTGFHQELTGRENVYMNGTILGMTKREIDRKFDQIVDFSGVEKFLDTPIKHYSSGMKVRLAFSVAAHLEPEILIIDEVLAVGDTEFQKRCLGKMQDVAQDGRTVLFVSHNMPAIVHLCSRCLVFDQGKLAIDTTTDQAVFEYSRLCGAIEVPSRDLASHPGRTRGSIPTMCKIDLTSRMGEDGFPIIMGEDLYLVLMFQSATQLNDITFGFVVKNQSQMPIFGINNLVCPSPRLERPMHDGSIVCHLEDLPLMPGTYYLDLYFGSAGRNFDTIRDAVSFSVEASNVFDSGRLPPAVAGSIFWPAKWHFLYDDWSLKKNDNAHFT